MTPIIRILLVTLATIAGLVGSAAPAPALGPAGSGAATVPELDWHGCPNPTQQGFECAIAQVPLDYGDPHGATIELALIRHVATGPGRRIGSLFHEPGGPGIGGTRFLPVWYQSFPREVRERFDVVSWDPRGVGKSTAVRCFDSAEQAIAWLEHVPTGAPVSEQERQVWIRAYAELGQRCQERDAELMRHVSSTDTARDLDQLRKTVGDEQLTFLGTSYGTFVGAIYANLFPGMVRAMILDGNTDPEAWTNTGPWPEPPRLDLGLRLGSDLSSSATLDQFLILCGQAAIERCAFSAGSPKATEEKFDRLMRRLYEHPQGTWTYGKTLDKVTTGIFGEPINPGWATLAEALQDLWEGRTPEQPNPPKGPAPYPGFEQEYAVACSEGPSPRNPRNYYAMELFSYARAGDVGRWWTWDYEPCATWPAKAANRYTGPWNRPTANPILVVGNTYDPGTPYQGAQAMVSDLADARLLTLEGYGHTALLNPPSACIGDYESRYLIDGTLPPEGTVCKQDQPPFTTGSSPTSEEAMNE